MSGKWYTGFGDSFESWQYKKLIEDDYNLKLEPNTIKKYLQNVILIQKSQKFSSYPTYKYRIKNYIRKIKPNFNPIHLKYTDNTDLDKVSNIISNVGRSGYEYIHNVENIIDLNKPVLLFYGVEHLASFYINLHLNFTEDNKMLSQISRRRIIGHGINPHNFNNISAEVNLEDILYSEIKLMQYGLFPRFLLLSLDPLLYAALNNKKLSLLELLLLFFKHGTSIGISNNICNEFFDEYSIYGDPFSFSFNKRDIFYFQDLDLFLFYTLAFLFSHLARYRVNTWKTMLLNQERSFGFFIKFIVKTITKLFLRRIFSLFTIISNDLILKLRKLELLD